MDTVITGWLSPSGEFVPCNSYDHIATARELVERFQYQNIMRKGRNLPDDDILLENGWAYIGISVLFSHEFSIGWKSFLTDYQKQFLQPYFNGEYNLPVNSVAKMRWEYECYEHNIE